MGLWELTLPAKIPSLNRHLVNDVRPPCGCGNPTHGVRFGTHGCCHGHAVFRKLSFVYVLYKDNVYNFDRHRATPICVLGFVSHLMPMPALIVTGAVARTCPKLPGSESSADIAMHAIMGGSASSPPTTAHV